MRIKEPKALRSKLLRVLVTMAAFMSLARAEGEGKHCRCVDQIRQLS